MESDTNKIFTDEQLDDLIRQSFHRQQMVDEINLSVMKQLRHQTFRRSLLRWGKYAAFAFGIPMVLVLFGWMLWTSVSQSVAPQFSILNSQMSIFICLLLPVATMLYFTWRAIVNFSTSDV